MRIKIKIKVFDDSITIPKILDKGEWIDLRSSEYVKLKCPIADTLKRGKKKEGEINYRNVKFSSYYIPLGVAMKLPKGYEAVVLPRSSTFRAFGIIQANSQGVIDNSYNGDDDMWKFPVISLRDSEINKGDRICQFRIQLSQRASFIQKIKWLFSSGIELIKVPTLNDTNRGGFGSTGIY